MMDWTDRHERFFLRQISRRARLYTEMITTGAILHGDRQRLLGFNADEHPVALQIVRSVREVNRDCRVAVRCRWAMNVAKFQLAGADAVVSEEREASQAMLRLCEQLVGGQNNEEDG